MTILKPKEDWIVVDPSIWIISWTSENLKNSLNLGDLLKEYNDITPTLVQVKELRDAKEYTAEEILSKILEEAKKYWYTDLEVTGKKIDQDGNIISISLKWHSNNHGEYVWNSYFWIINFNRACTYWVKTCWDETTIDEECFDSEDDDIPIGGDVIYKF